MEVLCDREDQCLILRNALDLVSPLASHFHRSLDSLRTGVHGQDHVEAEQLGGVLGESWEDIVVECTTTESQARCLLSQCLDKLGMTVALVHGGVC